MLFKNYTFVDPVLSRKAISCVDKWTGPVGVDYTVKEIIDTVCPGLYDMIDEKDYLRIGRAVRKKYNLNHYHHIKAGKDRGETRTYRIVK